MNDNYFIGIYWGVRKDILESCVDKLYETFSLFSKIDKSLERWYETARPLKGQIVEPIELTKKNIQNLLIKGQNYDDFGALLEDLGFTIYLKSDRDFSKSHVLSINCGCYNERLLNCLTISIGKNTDFIHLKDMEKLKIIYSDIKRIWNPQKGIIRINDNEVLREDFSFDTNSLSPL